MKNLVQIFSLLSLTFLFSSCFEITEEVNMKSNGTGDMILTVNLSQSKVNLKNYMEAGEFQGYKLPTKEDIKAEIAQVKKVVAAIDGMSNVKTNSDFEEFIFTITGDFSKVEALNQAINKVADAMNKTPMKTIKKDNFDYKTGTFTRHFDYLDEFEVTEEEYKNFHFTAKFVMETAKYISVYRFDKPVKKVTNTKAQLAPNKKAVKMESNLAEILMGKKTIANTITF